MAHNDDISTELKGLAPALATLERVHQYEVPEGYFESFSTVLIQELTAQHMVQESALLAAMDRNEVYAAPEAGYFDRFSNSLMAEIHRQEVAAELAHAAPVLAGLPRKQFYTVPKGYFSVFPTAVTMEATREEGMISTRMDRWKSRLTEWADALISMVSTPSRALAMASVASMAVVLVLVLHHGSVSADERLQSQLAQLPESEIHHYIMKHGLWVDERNAMPGLEEIELLKVSEPASAGAETPSLEDVID